jgi:hypothetical protein
MVAQLLKKFSAFYVNSKVHYRVGFEVLIAAVMKSSVFGDITPFSPLKVNRLSGGACCLHPQCRKINQESSMMWVASTGFLLGLSFDLEDGGNVLLRKVGSLSTDYMALYPRR